MGKRRRPRSEPAAPDRAAPPPRTPSPPRSTSPSTPPRSQLRLPRHTRLRPTPRDTSPAQPPRNTAPQPSSAGQPPPVRRHRPAAPHPRPGSATRGTAGARAHAPAPQPNPHRSTLGRGQSTDGSTRDAAGARTDPPRQGQGVDVSTEARPGRGQIRRGTDGSTMARPGDGAHPPAPPRDAPLPGDSATPTRSSPGLRLACVWPASNANGTRHLIGTAACPPLSDGSSTPGPVVTPSRHHAVAGHLRQHDDATSGTSGPRGPGTRDPANHHTEPRTNAPPLSPTPPHDNGTRRLQTPPAHARAITPAGVEQVPEPRHLKPPEPPHRTLRQRPATRHDAIPRRTHGLRPRHTHARSPQASAEQFGGLDT